MLKILFSFITTLWSSQPYQFDAKQLSESLKKKVKFIDLNSEVDYKRNLSEAF